MSLAEIIRSKNDQPLLELLFDTFAFQLKFCDLNNSVTSCKNKYW